MTQSKWPHLPDPSPNAAPNTPEGDEIREFLECAIQTADDAGPRTEDAQEALTALERLEWLVCARAAAHGASNSIVLRSGERAEVLTPAEQEAKSWKKIEDWHATQDQHPLCVEFLGPFEASSRTRYYARLPNGVTHGGGTRLEALAHLAQWCETEMHR